MGGGSHSLRTDHPSGALAVLFSVTVLRLLGLHDTGRSGVTTTCRRRMTVWGRPHDVSAHLLDSAIRNKVIGLDCLPCSFSWESRACRSCQFETGLLLSRGLSLPNATYSQFFSGVVL
ncbi:hypothetical protein BGY98DRAFT_253681 [Russula aff. rugulosa BPL654]|nr:hypothetical protein BGY98DRAFT_253681 [Russula aff. rugulosa BPL654]